MSPCDGVRCQSVPPFGCQHACTLSGYRWVAAVMCQLMLTSPVQLFTRKGGCRLVLRGAEGVAGCQLCCWLDESFEFGGLGFAAMLIYNYQVVCWPAFARRMGQRTDLPATPAGQLRSGAMAWLGEGA